MNRVAEDVREMYSRYPFPNVDYRLDYGIQLLRFFAQVAPPGKKSFLDGANILDAGCGTGNAVTQLAMQFPRSRVWAVDLTPASVAIGKQRALARGLQNLTFTVGDIMTLNLKEEFDAIISFGVLHHMADMAGGLQNLTRYLRGDGYLVLWLYGKYGRFRLNLNQAMFRVLLKNVSPLSAKVALAKRALVSFPRPSVTCHFNVPRTEIEDDFEKALEFACENEAWLVDQFLHVKEEGVNIDDILTLFDQSGLRLTRWLSVSQDLASYTGDEELVRIFRGLDGRDQLRVLDLLIKPNYYLVVAQRDGRRNG